MDNNNGRQDSEGSDQEYFGGEDAGEIGYLPADHVIFLKYLN